jgi:hypothetical protein
MGCSPLGWGGGEGWALAGLVSRWADCNTCYVMPIFDVSSKAGLLTVYGHYGHADGDERW